MSQVPGYSYGSPTNATSPVRLDDLDLLKATLLWSEEDDRWRRRAGELLVPQAEDVLDVWYGFVGSSPHLVSTFAGADGQPDGDYLAAVRRRFVKWIDDTCSRDLDQQWLDQQHEIARRHTRDGKNTTDGVTSTSASASALSRGLHRAPDRHGRAVPPEARRPGRRHRRDDDRLVQGGHPHGDVVGAALCRRLVSLGEEAVDLVDRRGRSLLDAHVDHRLQRLAGG